MSEMMNCPVCELAGCSKDNWSGKASATLFEYRCKCPRCGCFILADILKDRQISGMTSRQRAVLSHRLRRMQRANGASPEVLVSLLPKIDDPLPSPAEQADSLILWVGDHQPSQGQALEIPGLELSAWIGAPITSNSQNEGLIWLLQQPQMKALIEEGTNINGPIRLQLTFAGWQRHETLKRAQVESRRAFMAMKFGDEELNRVVNACFKPAVARTGFELRILTESQPAGLIDDQMRVALQTSRFAIADLTHGNNGAYWEAGFGEGLGRPVIYTCRKKEWDEGKAHFDTSHLNTIIWDVNDLEGAAARLTATIRATLPAEARLTD